MSINRLTPEDIARLIYENHEEQWMNLGRIIHEAVYIDSG